MLKMIRFCLKGDGVKPKLQDPFIAQGDFFQRKDNMIIFDVGAYIGEIAKNYRDIFPNAKIYCFEPFPDSFKTLRQSFKDELIKPFQLAISNNVSKTKLYVSSDPTCNSFFARPREGVTYYPKKSNYTG